MFNGNYYILVTFATDINTKEFFFSSCDATQYLSYVHKRKRNLLIFEQTYLLPVKIDMHLLIDYLPTHI